MQKYFLLFIILTLLSGCEKEFSSQEFFPLDKDFLWTFSGPLKEIKVAGVDTVAGGINYTLIYSDSLGAEAWQEELILRDGNVYLRSYRSNTNLLPSVIFDPPIPVTPISDNRNEIDEFKSTATHFDSTRRTFLIRVDYQIEEIENLETPAGKFNNCIKQKMAITYVEPPVIPLFEETTYWWFAKNIGPVKYSTTTDEGILHNAMLGLQIYPLD